jgi:nitrite reductase/ring-hydroxylating ferredoxin subunit
MTWPRPLAFLSGILLLSACAALRYTPQEALVPPSAYTFTDSTAIAVDLSQVPSLQAIGGAATVVDDRLSRHLLIARPTEGEYLVVAAHCTHGGRALSYEHEGRRLRCSSLGHSEFELDGAVISGPADGPVQVYRSRIEGDRLVIELTACCAAGCPHAAEAASE